MAGSANSIDWTFIKDVEGVRKLAYVPGVKTGTSGVTIAAGLDLRKHTIDELKAWGLSEPILKKIEPFVGMAGQSARDQLVQPEYLELGNALNVIQRMNAPGQGIGSRSSGLAKQNNPLAVRKNHEGNYQAIEGTGKIELTDSELNEIVAATKQNQLKDFIKAYDKAAGSKGNPHFGSLPPDIQTGFASLVFQYGYIWMKDPGDRRRDIWDAAVEGDWGKYIEILFTRFNEKAFTSRRVKEMMRMYRALGLIKECPLGPESSLMFAEFARKIPRGSAGGGASSAASNSGSSPASSSSSGPSIRLG